METGAGAEPFEDGLRARSWQGMDGRQGSGRSVARAGRQRKTRKRRRCLASAANETGQAAQVPSTSTESAAGGAAERRQTVRTFLCSAVGRAARVGTLRVVSFVGSLAWPRRAVGGRAGAAVGCGGGVVQRAVSERVRATLSEERLGKAKRAAYIALARRWGRERRSAGRFGDVMLTLALLNR
jgi:hypothetical protein